MARSFPGVLPVSGETGSGTIVRRVAFAALFLLAYMALERISFIHEYKGVPITPWNPGLGAVFALMMLGGPVFAIVLFAGVVAAETLILKTNQQWALIFGIAGIVASVYGTTAVIATTRMRLDTSLYHLRDVFVLLAAGILGAVVSASALAVLLVLHPDVDISWSESIAALVPLIVGDAIGIAVVTPLLLRLFSKRRSVKLRTAAVLESTLYAAMIGGSLWVIAGAGTASGFKFFYLLFVPVTLAAVRYGLDGACFALTAAQLGLVVVLQSFAADARTFTEFQILMLVLTATGLVVGAVVSERDNSDEHALQAEAKLKQKEAEAAQSARFTLVSGMASALAHEINQPMTAARALARSAQELLRKADPDVARAAGNLATVITQVDHAGTIVKRMRDFLRRGYPRSSTIDATEMLDDVIALANAEAATRNISIRLSTAKGLPAFHGDRVQLQQVVLNLIRNSIDAIDESHIRQGMIEVGVRHAPQKNSLEFSVLDNGPGIGPDLVPKLFQPLVTSKHEGLGLGLPICVQIVESHGGKIWLETGDAGATEFRFTIPVAGTVAT